MSGDFMMDIAIGESGLRAYCAIPEAGRGPGLVLFRDATDADRELREIGDLYAAEGYVVLCLDASAAVLQSGLAGRAVEALRRRGECAGKIGALGFGIGAKLAYLAAAEAAVDCAVSYHGVDQALELASRIRCPLVMHFAENDPRVPPEAVAGLRQAFADRPDIAIHQYPGVASGFDRKAGPNYDRTSAGLAHSRSIAVLRKAIGPCYDLEALWERHTTYEFAIRDVTATMRTMVAEPYVNHIPVMTGGVGQRELARFYANHFIPKLPADTRLVPVSRTVGADRIVDEMLFCFTHDVEIDFLLPGVPPTGKYVEVPTVAIVSFRGDKIWHEHIYWDQASVLVQIGLLDPQGLPVAGIEAAHKLLDETCPSNTLMKRWAESE